MTFLINLTEQKVSLIFFDKDSINILFNTCYKESTNYSYKKYFYHKDISYEEL